MRSGRGEAIIYPANTVSGHEKFGGRDVIEEKKIPDPVADRDDVIDF
jgi:hypothetical protein